eukprot:jgi/Mesen1/8662/ME000504S08110
MKSARSADLSILQKTVALRPTAPSAADAAAQKNKWMQITVDGNMEVECNKYAIMSRVGIHARDLRILDPLLSYPSTLLGRERAIVVNLEHIKAIITAEEVLLRNSTDDKVIPFVRELTRRLASNAATGGSGRASQASDNEGGHMQQQRAAGGHHQGHRGSPIRPPLPRPPLFGGDGEGQLGNDDEEPAVPAFEFQALEVVLEEVCSFLDARTTELETAAAPALDELTTKISTLNLDRVRKIKNLMSRLIARVQKVKDELEQLLDDDDDMAEMFLTRKLSQGMSAPTSGTGSPLSLAVAPTPRSRGLSRVSTVGSSYMAESDDIEELEQLLEAYFTQVDGTLNKLNALREYIDDTEDYINIQLDNHRNQLIQVVIVAGLGCASVFFSLIFYAKHKRIIA